MPEHAHASATQSHTDHYTRLLLMAVLSFAAMYVLMYAMVNRIDNVYANVNQFYMAGLMTAAMLIIELALMRAMYRNNRLNVAIVAASLIALVVLWMFTRRQTAVSDGQFLRSMIPHHGGAVLMCTRAPIQRAEIKRLCQNIIANQTSEIAQMKGMLREKHQVTDVDPLHPDGYKVSSMPTTNSMFPRSRSQWRH